MSHITQYLIVMILGTFMNVLYTQNIPENYREENVYFTYNGNEISGRLIVPVKKSSEKLPVIVFVHGSGPEDYSSSDLYRHLWEEFTKIGFACFSWDRPGVGQSQGKWYELSIEDRADEVTSATNKLKTLNIIDSSKIGFWGISQAGWVIPLVVEDFKPAFLITVSSPVTTAFKQELYSVKSGMKAEGFSQKDINKAISYNRKIRRLVSKNKPYEEFLMLQKEIEGLQWANNVISGNEIVYNYLSIVFKEDKAPRLNSLNCPVLAIWGENDLVVPPIKSSETYKKQLQRISNRHALIKIIPNADHTLTFNRSGKRSETTERRKLNKDDPREIFAPGYISLMTNWLQALDSKESNIKID